MITVQENDGRNASSAQYKTMGEVSDGYHTFNELYDHRVILFICLMKSYPEISWRSFKHEDGSSIEGWFIAGMHLPTGKITYHLPEKHWDDLTGYVEPLDHAPEWDGHTSKDVLNRLTEWLNTYE